MIVPDIEEGARWTGLENGRTGPTICAMGAHYPEGLRPNAVSHVGQIAPPAEFAGDAQSSNLYSVVGPASSGLRGRISQPTVLPSGQMKIGC